MEPILPDNPASWIEALPAPEWDAYFMSMVFLAAMRSPDQETKQGCVIVDWPSKVVLGTGYNGHPRGSRGYYEDALGNVHHLADRAAPHVADAVPHELPTRRPGKYFCMVHADTNAMVNCRGTSDHAVVYLPMPPCEACLGVLANSPFVKVRRIVYLEDRDYPQTARLLRHLPHIKLEKYAGQHPAEVLVNAATYAALRTRSGAELSRDSAKSYHRIEGA